MDYTIFLFFLVGILFVEIFLPLIESVTAIILTALECIKGRLSLVVAKYNSKLATIEIEANSPPQPQIGFVLDTMEEDEDDL